MLRAWRAWRRAWPQTRSVSGSSEPSGNGLVLGVFSDPTGKQLELTRSAEKFNKAVGGRLVELLKLGKAPKLGEVRIFYGLVEEYSAVAVAGLGEECVGYSETEQLDESKEAVREASAAGCQALHQQAHVSRVSVESFGHTESAAEGATLGLWVYQELRRDQIHVPKIELFDDCDVAAWQIGLEKASAQNLARQLSEMPANMLTPSMFAQHAVQILSKSGVNVDVKVSGWAKRMKMDAFLASARGSCETPIFLDLSYYGLEDDVPPIVLIGKGATFDSGGLCLYDKHTLAEMRGDMGSAACIVATCRAISKLQIPINVRAFLPLYENLPGTCSLKLGDVLTARNGKTVMVEQSDLDGRLCLADALSLAYSLSPKFVLTVATLSRDLVDVLGSAALGVFSNNDSLFDLMRIASIHTGDRIWRLPLWSMFTEAVTSSPRTDLGAQQEAGPCCAAAFLREFIGNETDWIHLDSYNVNTTEGRWPPYLARGMTGRPTRTLIEFLAQLACAPEADKEKEPSSSAIEN